MEVVEIAELLRVVAIILALVDLVTSKQRFMFPLQSTSIFKTSIIPKINKINGQVVVLIQRFETIGLIYN